MTRFKWMVFRALNEKITEPDLKMVQPKNFDIGLTQVGPACLCGGKCLWLCLFYFLGAT